MFKNISGAAKEGLRCPVLNRPIFDAVRLEPCGHFYSKEEAKKRLAGKAVCHIDGEYIKGYMIQRDRQILVAKEIYNDSFQVSLTDQDPIPEIEALIGKGKKEYAQCNYHRAMMIFARVVWLCPSSDEAKKYLAAAINAEDPFDPVPLLNRSYPSGFIGTMKNFHQKQIFALEEKPKVALDESKSPLHVHRDHPSTEEKKQHLIGIAEEYFKRGDLKKGFPVLKEILTICSDHRFCYLVRIAYSYDFYFDLQLDTLNLTGATDEEIEDIIPYCSHITSLTLHECRTISDRAFQTIVRYCKKLTFLDLKGCSSISNDGVYLVAISCKDLKEINLTRCDKVCAEGFSAIFRANKKLLILQQDPQKLEEIQQIVSLAKICKKADWNRVEWKSSSPHHLNLSQWKEIITDEGAEFLVHHHPQLISLDLSDCSKITSKGLLSIAKYCMNLKALNVWMTHIPYYDFFGLIGSCKNLEQLEVYPLKDIELTPSWVNAIVAFSQKCQKGEFARVISFVLPEIDSFRFSKDCGNEEVSLFVKHYPLYQFSLDLRNCSNITDRGLEEIAQYCVASSKQLIKIHLSKNRQITSHGLLVLMRSCQHLQKLESSAEFHQQGIESLALFFAGCTELECERAVRLLFPRKKSADFLQPYDVQIISQLLKLHNGKNLEVLMGNFFPVICDWSRTELRIWQGATDEILELIMKYCPGVQGVHLKRCSLLTDRALQLIGDSFGHSLTEIDLEGCAGMTIPGILKLNKKCPSLTALTLPQHPKISEEYFRTLVKFMIKKSWEPEWPKIIDFFLSPKEGTWFSPYCHYVTPQDIEVITQFANACIQKNSTPGTLIAMIAMKRLIPKELDLYRCRKVVTDDIIETIAKLLFPSHLCLKGCSLITDRALASIIRFSGDLRQVSFINLVGCTGVTAQAIFKLVQECTSLEDIILPEQLEITDEYIAQIAEFLRTSTEAESERIVRLLLKKKKVHEAHKVSFYLQPAAIKTIVQLSKICSQEQLSNAIGMIIPANCLNLYLRDCAEEVDDHVIEIITNHCEQIVEMDLTGCRKVTIKGIQMIAIDHFYCSSIDQELLKMWVECREKNTITLEESDLKNLLANQTPNFEDCADFLTDEILALFFTKDSPTTSLGLLNCKKITDKGLQKAASRCNGRLDELNLAGCTQITDQGILTALLYFDQIDTLILPNGTYITDDLYGHTEYSDAHKAQFEELVESYYSPVHVGPLTQEWMVAPEKPFYHPLNPSSNLDHYYKESGYDPFLSRIFKRVAQYLDPIPYFMNEAKQGNIFAQVLLAKLVEKSPGKTR